MHDGMTELDKRIEDQWESGLIASAEFHRGLITANSNIVNGE